MEILCMCARVFFRSLSLCLSLSRQIVFLLSHKRNGIKDAISSNTNKNTYSFASPFVQRVDLLVQNTETSNNNNRHTHTQLKKAIFFLLNSFHLLFKFTRIFVASPESPYYLPYIAMPNTRIN